MGEIITIVNNGVIQPGTPIDYSNVSKVHFDGTYYHVRPKKVIKQLLFETSKDLSDWNSELPVGSSLTTQSTIKKTGNNAGRFELNKTDTDVFGSKRAELAGSPEMIWDRWYGFANYFPSAFVSDTETEIVAQWHDVPDTGETTGRSPSISLGILNDAFYLDIRWDADASMQDNIPDGRQTYDLGSVTKDTWISWVVHIKWSYTNMGITEVWKNGVKLVDRSGPNWYNDAVFPYFKFGIYKPVWSSNPSASLVSQRVLYYDEVRIGNENATYNDVAPN